MTIEKLPSGAHRIRVSAGTNPNGTRRRLSRTMPAGTTRRDLRRAELELEIRAAKTETPADQIGLAQLVDLWIGDHDGRRAPKTQRQARTVVSCWLHGHDLGEIPIGELTTGQIEQHYRRITSPLPPTERPVGSTGAPTVKQLHARIRAALNWAVRMGWLTTNPSTLVSPIETGGRSKVKATDPTDYRRALVAADEVRPGLASFLLFLGQTGARKSEGLALNWSNIAGDVITIEGTVTIDDGALVVKPPKTGRTRKLVVGADLVDALNARRSLQGEYCRIAKVPFDPFGFVWSSDECGAQPWRPDTAGKWALKAGVRPGELRHMVATQLLAAGIPIGVVADRLGHASPSMTLDVYQEALPADDKAAAAILDELGR